MLPSFELLRWVGVGFILVALALAGIEMNNELDEPYFGVLMAGGPIVLLVGLGVVAPDFLLGLSYVLGLGGWIFYVLGIIAPVYFASRLLVVG